MTASERRPPHRASCVSDLDRARGAASVRSCTRRRARSVIWVSFINYRSRVASKLRFCIYVVGRVSAECVCVRGWIYRRVRGARRHVRRAHRAVARGVGSKVSRSSLQPGNVGHGISARSCARRRHQQRRPRRAEHPWERRRWRRCRPRRHHPRCYCCPASPTHLGRTPSR